MKKFLLISLILALTAGCTSSKKLDQTKLDYSNLIESYKTDYKTNLKPESPIKHYHQANALLNKVDKMPKKKQKDLLQNAISEYQKSLTLDSSYAPAYYGLGIAQAKNKDFHSAFDSFNKAVLLDPYMEEYYLAAASACESGNKEQCAVDKYRQILEINPNNERALVLLGNHELEKKNYEDAKELFEAVLAFDKENLLAKKGLEHVKQKMKSSNASKPKKVIDGPATENGLTPNSSEEE